MRVVLHIDAAITVEIDTVAVGTLAEFFDFGAYIHITHVVVPSIVGVNVVTFYKALGCPIGFKALGRTFARQIGFIP